MLGCTFLALVPVAFSIEKVNPYSNAATLGVNGHVHFVDPTWHPCPDLSVDPTCQSVDHSLDALNSHGVLQWSWFANNSKIQSHSEGLNGNIHVVTSSYFPKYGDYSADATLQTLDGSDGSVLWQHHLVSGPGKFGSDGRVKNIEVYPGQHIVYVSYERPFGHPWESDKFLDAIDEAGVQKWSRSLSNMKATFQGVGPDGSLLITSSDKLHLLEPELGTVKWTLEIPKDKSVLSRERISWAWSDDGVLVTVLKNVQQSGGHSGGDLDLLHLRGADGGVLWNVTSHLCPESVRAVAPLMGSNGVVYIKGLLDKDGVACSVRAISPGGNISLPFHASNGLSTVVAGESEEGTFVLKQGYHSSFGKPKGSNVVGYSTSDGQVLWNASFPGDQFPSVQLGPHETTLAYGAQGSHSSNWPLVAIQNGVEAWRATAYGLVLMSKDGTTYADHIDIEKGRPGNYSISAFDLRGFEKWSYPKKMVLV